MTPGADAGASALSGNGGLSSGFAAEFSGTDLSQASQVFQAGTGDGGALAAKALSGLDISGISSAAATPLAGTEAAAFMPPTPGGEAALLAAANDPISPLVQLIMKLPGAMGIVNSFFEFLAAFFNPTNFLDFLNPINLAQTAASAFQNLASHAPAFSLSMLPGNAPILNGMAQPMFSSDFLSAKLNMSIGNSSAYSSALAKPAIDVLPGGQSLNVGGELQAQQAVFETGGANGISVPQGHLSGPSLSDVGTSNHVAGNTRLFSDRMSGGSSFNSMNLAAKTPSPYGTPAAPTGISHGVGSNSIQGLNPGAAANSFQPASNFVSHARFEGAPNLGNVKEGFAPQSAQNVGYEATPSVAPQDVGFNAGQSAADASGVSYGPSGYVGRELGVAGSGNNNLIAMDQPVQSFRPTLSGADSQMRSAFPSNQQPGSPAASGGGQGGVGTGLKAKQLSLDSIADSAVAKPANVPANHGAQASKMASAPKSAETAMSKASAPTNNSADSVHKTVDAHKSVEAPAHKAASASHKTADSAAHKVAHKADAPAHKVSHAPAHRNAEVAQAPKSEVANQQQQLDANGNPTDANSGMAADGSTVTDGTQIAQGDAAAATTQHYTVQKGDSLWNIAKNNLGDGSKWQEIYQLNQGSLGQNPDLIYPGTDLQLPGGAPEIANSGTSTMTNYTVKPGDNLWDISEEVLGKGDRWGELYQANQEIIGANPRLIHPGQNLNIPGAVDPANAGVASAPDPNSMGIDPAAAGAQSPQPVAPQEISSGIDSVKSTASDMSAQQYVPRDIQAMPAAQAVPQAVPQTVSQAAAPEQLSYFEQSMNAAQAHAPAASTSFQPTVASASRGLPVLPANNVPLEVGPGAAMAATPVNPAAAAAANHAQSAAAAATSTTKNGVVATEAFSHLKDLFGKSK
jgi:nucleoid-associated protein YgaU